MSLMDNIGKRPGPSEFGGSGGLVQPEVRPDGEAGHVLSGALVEQENDATRELAMIERIRGRREAAGLPELSDEELRARLSEGNPMA